MKSNREPVRKEVSRVQPRFTKTAVLTNEQYEELDDKYYYDRSKTPDGMTYEWKRYSILGKEDPTYQAKMRRHGWVPVPSGRHPETTGEGSTDEPIIIEGQILMECPTPVYERAKERIASETNSTQKDHFERLRLTTPSAALKFSKSIEQAIPE